MNPYINENKSAIIHSRYLRVVVVVVVARGAFLLVGSFLRYAVIYAYLALHHLVAGEHVTLCEVRRVAEDDAALGALVHLAYLR